MPDIHPLRFRPLFKRYLWGGRRLSTELGKPIGPGDDWAESWEVCDHGTDQSVVAFGPLAGTTLAELVKTRARELLGRHAECSRFPLLFKFLDAHETLSVQVHPDDDRARRLDPPDLGKTEAWVVLAAEPGSLVYAGLKRGFDRSALERELARGTCELCLHKFEPAPGDCIFLPAGAVHALGKGLLVAEIQQSSDTTYRLFDWNRVGPDGQPRALHIAEGLDAIDYGLGPLNPVSPRPAERAGVERLVDCDKFILDRWTIDAPRTLGDGERCQLIAVLDGDVAIVGDPAPTQLHRGETALIPACLGPVELTPTKSCVLLNAYLPG